MLTIGLLGLEVFELNKGLKGMNPIELQLVKLVGIAIEHQTSKSSNCTLIWLFVRELQRHPNHTAFRFVLLGITSLIHATMA